MTNRKHHLQLTVIDVLWRQVNILFLESLVTAFKIRCDLFIKEGIALHQVPGFVLRHIVQPGHWILRDAFDAPGLRGSEKSIAGQVFGRFHLSKSKMPAEHGYDLPVFRSE